MPLTYTATDPLAQTFEILRSEYPDGLFLSSCDVFFQSKDATLPVTLDIRRVSLGTPTKFIVPTAVVTLLPSQVNISNDSSAATTFTFANPVYLEPDEYAIVVSTNTEAYNLFVSELGQDDLISGNKVTKQPFNGSLFKSQNSSTWTPDQFKDLKFTLRRCSFTVGSGTVDLISKQFSSMQKYVLARTLSQELIPGKAASVSYQLKTRTASSNTIGSFETFTVNQNKEFPVTQQINPTANGEITVRATLSTTNEAISPMVDVTRLGGIVIRNTVNNTTTGETTARSGEAAAKYITRRVTLAQGFDAETLKVFINVNRPPSTDIKVYYKVLSRYDSTNFDDRGYVEMTKVDSGGDIYTPLDRFIEEQYLAENIEYTEKGGRYTDFRVFAIKVVFLSSNEAVVPKIAALRVLALS
jgi:hypothetical protein